MYELTTLLTTIAGCTATIIAIIGGFIASKLIALNDEKVETITKLTEIEKELKFKSDKYNKLKEHVTETNALRFILKKLEFLIFNINITEEIVLKENINITVKELLPFWEKARKLFNNFIETCDKGSGELDKNSIPLSLIKENSSKFDYEIYHRFAKVLNNPKGFDLNKYNIQAIRDRNNIQQHQKSNNNDMTYTEKDEELSNLKLDIKWLDLQRKQLLYKKRLPQKATGIKEGLIILTSYSISSIIAPLIFIPYETTLYCNYIILKISMIILFTAGLITVFGYLIWLLKWKKEKTGDKQDV